MTCHAELRSISKPHVGHAAVCSTVDGKIHAYGCGEVEGYEHLEVRGNQTTFEDSSLKLLLEAGRGSIC